MERKSWINVRGLALLAVIMIHASASRFYPEGINGSLNLLLNQISRFAVPVFFIASGYGLFISKKQELPIKKYFIERYKVVLPIYLFWTVFYFALFSSSKNITSFLLALATGNARPHLYYLVVLMFFYLIYPFVYKYLKTKEGLLVVSVLTIVSQVIIQINEDSILNNDVNPLNWILYFGLGIYLANNQDIIIRLKEKSILLLSSGLLLVLITSFVSYLFTNRDQIVFTSSTRPEIILYSVGVLFYCLSKLNIPNKYLAYFDKHSLLIYAVHPFFKIGINKVLRVVNLDNNNVIVTLVLFSGMVVCSIITVQIVSMIKSKIIK
ncbi:acyltransferase [Vagococcus fluvialis]|uniref:acyltransferase n=1 Tax=Vagococcus fluvialis TaxID=2738 RepID=UPI003D0F5BB3